MAVLVLGAGLLVGCAARSAAPQPAGKSGVTGTATVDGGCPVVHPDNPCPGHPMKAVIAVALTGSAESVARVPTDDQGHFRIPLEPGTYVLHPGNSTDALLPRAAVQTVTVPAGKFVEVVIRFDSGVRGPVTDD